MQPIMAFEPPTPEHLFELEPIWRVFDRFDITFITLVMFIISAGLLLFFWRALSKRRVVPTGSQNVAESWIELVENQIVLPVIGPDGRGWTPFLVMMFFWVFFNNITGIIPGIQMPVTSRMAYPVMLSMLVWLIYNGIGIKSQGFFKYLKSVLFMPGVPKVMYVLLTPIEFFSTIVVRPFTLALRLAANMIAGHMLLAVLFIGTAVFIESGIGRVAFVLPLAFGTIMTGFEVFVAGMQAFIITILSAVFIAGAANPEH